jgi:hypothetical protein
MTPQPSLLAAVDVRSTAAPGGTETGRTAALRPADEPDRGASARPSQTAAVRPALRDRPG